MMENTERILDDLLQRFQSRDDSQAVVDVQRQVRELLTRSDKREAQIRRELQELRQAVKVKKQSIASDSEEAFEQGLSDMQTKRKELQGSILKMKDEAIDLEELLHGLDEQASSLQRRRKRLESLTREQMPRTLYEVSLYGNISSLIWDDTDPNSAKGCITHGGAQITIFSAQGDTSDFAICNSLWDAISPSPSTI